MEYNRIPGEGYQVNGQVLTYFMPKELDHHVAQSLCRELDLLVETHRIMELILDFEKTEFMDSSGIGVLIGRGKTMQFRGGRVCAVHMGKRVNMIFQSAGLNKMIEVKEG